MKTPFLAMAFSLMSALPLPLAGATPPKEPEPNLLENRTFSGENPLHGWQVNEAALVTPGNAASGGSLLLRRAETISGSIHCELDTHAYHGRQLAVTFEAKVDGGVKPWFEVRSLDGKLSKVARGLKMEPTDLLGELDRFGWYYDHRYGWPVNSDLPHLFRSDWQQIGAIITIPEGVNRISLHIEPRPAKYGLIDRRPNAARTGQVEIRHPKVTPVEVTTATTSPWESEHPDTQSFFYLSYFYNQQQITLTSLQMRLWQLERWADQARQPEMADRLASHRKTLATQRTALSGLSHYYHQRFPSEIAKLDLSQQMKRYPAPKASGELIDIGGLRPYYLSLYIQDLVDGGFQLPSPAALEIQATTQQLAAALDEAKTQLLATLGAKESPELATLSYADQPAALTPSGKTPAILYATGNTSSPLRIYRDLNVDLFSKNYPVSTFNDKGLLEDPSLPAVLQRYGLRQISCLFTPVHGLFAVSDDFLAAHKGRWREFLREEVPGVAAIHARDPKTGLRDVLKLNLDTFEPEPGKLYILPINPLSPEGKEILQDRMKMIGQHIRNPDNRDTLTAVELSAEPTLIVGITSEPHTRAAFLDYLKEEAGSLETINRDYGTTLASYEALLDAEKVALPEALQMQRERWERAFRILKDAEIYHDLQSQGGLKETSVLHRNNDLYFSDFAWERASLKDDYVNYHAGWDRVYGYDLGRMLGKDHITGEDHPALPTGLKERHTLQQAFPNFLKALWGYAAWGTKAIQLWRPYREEAFHSIATFGSDYTLINENWTALPWMKEYTRAMGKVLDGEVLARQTAYLQLDQQSHITWYMPGIYTTNQFLRRAQIPYGYLFERALLEKKDSLNNYRFIIVPPSLFVSQAIQENLLQWVQEGGTLLLFGPMGLHDEHSRPSSWFMDHVFGPARYRLVGTAEQLRRPQQEGLWTIEWKEGQPAHVQSLPVPEELPLPPLEGALFEKKWNSFDHVVRLANRNEMDNDLLVENLVVAPSGKGKVIMVPRELLPNTYRDVLAETLGDLSSLSACHLSEPGFNSILRKAKGETGSEVYLMIQNEDEWQGRRSASVSLSGHYGIVEEIGDLRHAVPVATTHQNGRLRFEVSLQPGEIATFRLRTAGVP